MTEQLLLHIQQLVPGFTATQEELAPFVHTAQVKEGELLLREKEDGRHIYFVNKGCLYLFYEQNGRQVIHFAPENWWITDYKTFRDGSPAEFAIAAMEDSMITRMSRKDYETLLIKLPLMGLYFNKIHERAYGAALLKQKTFATVSKKDFYHYFRSTYPATLQRIPDPIFASYMGVSVEALQALRDEYIS